MRALIELPSRFHGVDYWTAGRTLAEMRLEGNDCNGIRRPAEKALD